MGRVARWLCVLMGSAGVLAAQSVPPVPPPSVSAGLRLKRGGPTRVAADSQGNVFVAGLTRDPAFFTTPGVHNRACGSDGLCGASYGRPASPEGPAGRGPTQHAFLIKITPDGGLAFSTFLGADGGLRPLFIVPTADAIFIGGEFSETPWPVPLQFPLTRAIVPGCGQSDAFVMKLDATASELVYATCIQGPSRQAPLVVRGFDVDASGAAVIGGYVNNPNFPVLNALEPVFIGLRGFVTKLTPEGQAAFNTYFGGRSDTVWSLDVDQQGDIYLAGGTVSGSLQTSRPFQSSQRGATDGFLAKLHRDGRALLFSTYFGGTATDVIWDVTVDRNGDAWVGGDTHSVDFPTTSDAFRARSLCGSDPGCASRNPSGFVSRFDADGRLRYSTLIGSDTVVPSQPGGSRVEMVLVGPSNELQVIADVSGPVTPIRPLTTEQCGMFPCGLLMTIGPGLIPRFASRFHNGNHLIYFGDMPPAALGPAGEMYMIVPTADLRESQLIRIGVHEP